tara:strand:- start:110 stop:1249 length:1140 start_codon:yes stop_codon:yes gene_type:complete
MSKMLQEAIVDAEALKEAALRNAEMAIIEKYEAEIKDAVSTLLEEAPEDEFALGGDEMGMESDEDIADDLLPAAADGEELCACPDVDGPDGGKVELDLDQLIATANAEAGAEQEMETDMGLAGSDMALEEEIDIDESVLAKLIEELTTEGEMPPALAKYQKKQAEADSDDDEDPELQADDDAPGEGRHASVKEELTVDVSPQSNGWAGVTEAELERAVEEAVAAAQDSELAEENEELRKSIKELEEQVQRYSNRVVSLKEDRDKIKDVALRMRDHVDGVNVQNARLLYTNQVLTSDSLNERQKDQIVEAISKADSVDEAKVIFNTLQSAVGTNNNKAPKSLSEVVERRSSTLPRAQVSEAKKLDPVSDRMKLLAGIVKK